MNPSSKPPHPVGSCEQSPTVDYAATSAGDAAAIGTNEAGTQTTWLAHESGEQAPCAETASLVGRSFDDFEVLRELGRGATGVVYKAMQKSLERLVAVKILQTGSSASATLRARFLTEARAGAALAHPCIPTIYQTGECQAGPYCAMEFVDGQTLASRIHGRLVTIRSALDLLVRVADAVAHAHAKGIIHRDLKPGNIMLARSRRPMVMDFGLAKMLEKPTGLTLHGQILGTPAYMAPEQGRGELAQIGLSTDVYGLGATLYRLLAGRPPFNESKAADTLVKVVSAEPPPAVRAFRPEVSEALEMVCMTCLHKDPARRYPSAKALAVELRRLQTAAPPGDTPDAIACLTDSQDHDEPTEHGGEAGFPP
jgi:eukaryotic-like serine/threonine-protein kinase